MKLKINDMRTEGKMELKTTLSVVAGRDEEVGHLCQLILSEGQLVLTPVVLVSSLPALDTLLDGG